MLALYFDFSGYTDMALGVGKLLGFDLAENFRWPLAARTLTDFWRRWHITWAGGFGIICTGRWSGRPGKTDRLPAAGVAPGGPVARGRVEFSPLGPALWSAAGGGAPGPGGWLNRVPPLGHLFVLAVLGFGAVLLTGENLGQSLALWGGLLGQGEPGEWGPRDGMP